MVLHDGFLLQFNEARGLECIDEKCQIPFKEPNQFPIVDISGSNKKEPWRLAGEQVRLDEIRVFRYDNPLLVLASRQISESVVLFPSGKSRVCIASEPAWANQLLNRRGNCASIRNFTRRSNPWAQCD